MNYESAIHNSANSIYRDFDVRDFCVPLHNFE